MRKNELIEKRNQMIFDRYNELYWGQLLRDDVIYPMLQEQFFIGRTSLYLIILKKGKEAEKVKENHEQEN